MVDMPVRDQNLLQHQPILLNGGENAFDITARIDHRRLLRFIAPEQAAVLFKRRDGDDLVFDGHG